MDKREQSFEREEIVSTSKLPAIPYTLSIQRTITNATEAMDVIEKHWNESTKASPNKAALQNFVYILRTSWLKGVDKSFTRVLNEGTQEEIKSYGQQYAALINRFNKLEKLRQENLHYSCTAADAQSMLIEMPEKIKQFV